MLVGADVPTVDLRLNGSLDVISITQNDADITGVTGGASIEMSSSVVQSIASKKRRKPDTRATLHIPAELLARINAKRGDMSQAEYIEHVMVLADLLEDA